MAEKVKKTALELKTKISKSVGENEERRIRFVASSMNVFSKRSPARVSFILQIILL